MSDYPRNRNRIPRHENPSSALTGLIQLGSYLSFMGICLAACAPLDDPSSENNAGEGGESGVDSGASSGESSTGNSKDIENVGPGQAELKCDENAPLTETPLFKLSTAQYKNTIGDLLHLYSLDSLSDSLQADLDRIPADSQGDSFRRLDERIAIEHVQGFFDVGVDLADALLASPTHLESVAGTCASATALSPECWEDFKEGFLTRALRHPLSEAESELFDALFTDDKTGPQVIHDAIVVGLSSPRFVYQVEVDGSPLTDESVLQLDAYELASRLSYTFWQTLPDDELFSAAADGSLLDEQTYADQLARIWEDPRTADTVKQFWNEWLRLEKFTGFETTRPGFAALTEGESFGQEGHDYYGDMMQEVFDLTHHFVFKQPSTLHELLTTNISVTASNDLAALYQVAPYEGDGDHPLLENRAGLLQRGALLVSNLEQTNPFHRGALIRRNILCGTLAQPNPNDLPAGSLDPPPIDEAQTTRERFQAKIEGNGLCENCHAAFTDIGFVLESFDAVGRFRTKERVFDEQTGELLAELDIDTSAEILLTARSGAPVANAQEMNALFAESGVVEACLAENYFQYFLRRAMDSSSLDQCVVDDMAKALADENEGLAGAFKRLAELPTFFTRKVGQP